MIATIEVRIAAELKVRPEQVASAVKLLRCRRGSCNSGTRIAMLPPRFTPIAVALLFLAAPSHAQVEFFGRWHDLAPLGTTARFFVDAASPPGGGVPNNPNSPYRTVTEVLQDTFFQAVFGVLPITINVLPGRYDSNLGQTFPIDLPAHGVCLEALGVVPAAGAVEIRTIGSAIRVTSIGNSTLPPTVIRGLDIEAGAGSFAIDVTPNGSIGQTSAVEIRDNFIHGTNCQLGLRVLATSHRAMEVIERNRIVTERSIFPNSAQPPSTLGVRLQVTPNSSPVMRSNEVARFDTNVQLLGGRSRLLSNLIQVAEENVFVAGANPILVNNTIAFAARMTLGTTNVFGIRAVGGSVTMVNNLVFNPIVGSGAGFRFNLFPQSGTTFLQTNDEIEGVTTRAPGFVSGDVHPGVATITPKDLHLSATSQMIDIGSTTAIVSPTGAIPAVMVGPAAVRTDCSMDVDLDMRAFGPNGLPDVGGDEVTDGTRLKIVASPTLDVFGNLRPTFTDPVTLASDFKIVLGVSPPSIAAGNSVACWLFAGRGFDITKTTALGLVDNRAIFESSFVPGLGLVGLDFAPGNIELLGIGGTQFVSVRQNVPLSFAEAEEFLQCVVFETDPQGAVVSTRLSNRVPIEFNQ